MVFENKELEKQYQQESSLSIKKPVFFCMLCLSIISNIFALIVTSTQQPIQSLYLNWILTFFALLFFILIFVMKKVQYLQMGITISNITIGFIQLNVETQTETQSESYAFGNAFMQIQAILYLISNFNHAITQVTIHLILRIIITIIQTSKLNWLLLGIGIFGGLMSLIALRFNENRLRLNFLQKLKENQLQEVYSFIINRPYFQISFQEGSLMFNLNTSHQINKFPGFDSYYCDGCNIRNLMRSYKNENKQNFESLLLAQQLEPQGILMIKFKKQTFQIKYCKIDLQQQNYLIILQEIDIQDKQQINIEQEQLKLKSFLKVNQDFTHKKIFNWGVLSILLLNNKIIQKIDLRLIITRLMSIYKKNLFPKLNVEIDCDEQNLFIYSFKNQLKIYLIQIFEIISRIQYFQRNRILIKIRRKGCNALIKIINIDQIQFRSVYSQNFFIQHVQSLLINNIETSDCIYIEVSNHPIGSFNQK